MEERLGLDIVSYEILSLNILYIPGFLMIGLAAGAVPNQCLLKLTCCGIIH